MSNASQKVVTGITAGALAALIAAVTAISVPHSQDTEGLRLDVYADPVHGWALPTVCYGDTGPDIQRGQPRRSIEECVERLLTRHQDLVVRLVSECIAVERREDLIDEAGFLAMLVSISDNTGFASGCTSSFVRDYNR
jgi:GH24 family phage-related lysozyme (muramidase)